MYIKYKTLHMDAYGFYVVFHLFIVRPPIQHIYFEYIINSIEFVQTAFGNTSSPLYRVGHKEN